MKFCTFGKFDLMNRAMRLNFCLNIKKKMEKRDIGKKAIVQGSKL